MTAGAARQAQCVSVSQPFRCLSGAFESHAAASWLIMDGLSEESKGVTQGDKRREVKGKWQGR